MCLSAGAADRAPASQYGPVPGRTNLWVAFPDPPSGVFDPATSIAQLRGRVVVLAFINPECPDCASAFDAVGATLRARTTLIAVLSHASRADALQLGESGFGKDPASVSVAADPQGALARRFRVVNWPTLLVLDRKGSVAERLEGARPDLAPVLRRVTRERPPFGYPRPRPVQPHLSVFDGPQGPLPRLPAHARRTLSSSGPCRIVPKSLRWVGRAAGTTLLVARDYDGSVVMATVDREGTSVACGVARFRRDRLIATRRLRATGIVAYQGGRVSPREGRPGRWHFEILVTDRWKSLRIADAVYPVVRSGVLATGTGAGPRGFAVLIGDRESRRIRLPFGSSTPVPRPGPRVPRP